MLRGRESREAKITAEKFLLCVKQTSQTHSQHGHIIASQIIVYVCSCPKHLLSALKYIIFRYWMASLHPSPPSKRTKQMAKKKVFRVSSRSKREEQQHSRYVVWRRETSFNSTTHIAAAEQSSHISQVATTRCEISFWNGNGQLLEERANLLIVMSSLSSLVGRLCLLWSYGVVVVLLCHDNGMKPPIRIQLSCGNLFFWFVWHHRLDRRAYWNTILESFPI